MALDVKISLKGLDQLEKAANNLVKAVNESKTKLLLREARKVEARIKEYAPLGPTGNLKKATYASVLPETLSSPAVAYAGIRPRKAPHAHLVEFGHGGPHPAPPHSFIRRAWDDMKWEVEEDIAREFGARIETSIEYPSSSGSSTAGEYGRAYERAKGR